MRSIFVQMRSIFVVAFILVALNACAGQVPTSAADKQAILNLDRQLTEAFLRGRCDVVERILAIDYSETGADGTHRNKSQVLETCKSLAAYPESIRPQPKVATDADVRLFQNVAVVTGKRTAEQQLLTYSDFLNKRPPIKLVDEVRYTMVWAKKDRWELVSAQVTKVSPPDPQ